MKNCLSSLASLTPEFSTTYGSTQTVRLALHMMDFHGPGSSTQCQASAGVHGTAQLDSSPARKMCCLERKVMLHNSGNRWMDESETLPPGMLGANCKVWWRRTNDPGLNRHSRFRLSCFVPVRWISSWSYPHLSPLGWTETLTVCQTLSTNISARGSLMLSWLNGSKNPCSQAFKIPWEAFRVKAVAAN